jgi:D-alanine-D-alanine ligase
MTNRNWNKVAVLMGGIGQERQVSLQSGKCVTDALQQAGVNVIASDIGPDDMSILDDKSIDVFFIALHGKFGEDGQLQKILEDKSLVFTGSGSAASRIAFDKIASKRAFESANVRTAPMIEVTGGTDLAALAGQIAALGGKYVVKPVRQGSSVGVSILDDAKSAAAAAKQCLADYGDCMVEKFIKGRELTVGVLCGKSLPVIEIRSKAAFYDYHAKYITDSTEYLFDTISDAKIIAELGNQALAAFDAVGCRDFSRIDFILSDDGVPYALEVNNIPGFTTHSLLPKAAAKTGIPMGELCIKIIDASVKRNQSRPKQSLAAG